MGGTVDDNIFNSPVELKVDYVHLYQLNTAVEEIKETQMNVYPTRFTNEIIIKTVKPTLIRIYNDIGNLIFDKTVNGDETINASNMPSGIYILKSNLESIKLIK